MNWLLVSWFLSFGYMPQNVSTIQETPFPESQEINATADFSGCFNQVIGFEATMFETVKIWTDIKTFDTIGEDSFKPFRSDYGIGLEVFHGPIAVGILHECEHPVIWNLNGQNNGYGGKQTEIYVKFSGEMRF